MRDRRGLTLLELLLVTAILGLVASVGAGAVLRALRSDPLQRGLAGMREADQRARLEARQNGPQVLLIQHDGWLLERADDSLRRLWTPPAELRVVLRDAEGQRVERIGFDAAGRGPDLQVELHDGRGRIRCQVLGLSGQWLEEQP